VALLQCLGGSAEKDRWEQFSPFELEETLDELGEDLSRALAHRGGLLLI